MPNKTDQRRESTDDTRAMTLRLNTELAEALELVAETNGASIAETVRTAIAEHIDSRRNDEEFQERLDEVIARNRRILQKLKK